jgi:hypothetical protein
MFVTVIAAIAASACASGGGARGARGAKCNAPPGDTIYRPIGMVYRPCAVDREARLTSSPRSTFTPNTNGGITCYTAEFEFVVDVDGKPVLQTVRPLRSNDRSFETSASQLIPGLLYEPAVKDGHPVNHITSWEQKASVVRVVVPAGAPVRPPSQRAPAC